MSENKILRVGITQGDINGIGPEVIIKVLADSRMTEMFTPVVYGSSKAFSYYKKGIEGGEGFSFQIISSVKDIRPKRVNFVETAKEDIKLEIGHATKEGGEQAFAALKSAVADLKAGEIDVLVTAPINKENIQQAGFGHTGHTEFFGEEFAGEPLMVMASDIMKVGLATIHIPLSKVSCMIGKELVSSRIKQLRQMLVSDFRIVEPRIAVLALNPHSGDGGLLGDEEADIIKPTIIEACKEGVLAFGPFAADGFFASGNFKDYDAVLAMYHDQGLIPFKSLSSYGVNFTACLPIVRTSPDHGVAYDIAGKDMAEADSMREAIYTAIDIYRNREWYKEISKNPLKRFERERGTDVSVRDLKLPEQSED